MDLDVPVSSSSCSQLNRNGNHGSNALVWSLFALLSVTAWARGGSPDITPWLQFGLASIVAAVFFWEVSAGSFRGFAGGIFRDPVFYLGAALLLLTGMQWYNSGRELYYDQSLQAWLYSEPRHSRLPFSFDAAEAQEVWTWFYSATVIVVSIRSSLMSRRGIYRLWKLMIVNSCLLGLFGLVQFLAGTDRIFWVKELSYQRFFASFGYSNHAGSYFLLSLFLASAMLVRRIFRHSPPRFTIKTALLLVAVVFSLVCANLSLSRYAILTSWLAVVWIAVYVVRRLWRRGSPAVKLNVTILLIGSGLLAAYAAFSAAGSLLGKELVSFLRLNDDFLGEGRIMMFRAGLSVWQESPWFGVGPWGFRHLVALHLDQALYFMLTPGAASIHNDALQYLVESGVFGLALMLCTGGAIIWHVRPAVLRRWMPGVILFAGAGVIAVQSLFDLPMRSPAVFYCWLAIISGASKIVMEKRREIDRIIGQPIESQAGLKRSSSFETF